MIRYCLLSYILCIRRLSARLRKRFPSCQEIMRTGLMRPDEAARIGDETSGEMYGSNWWLPLKVRKERSIFWREMNWIIYIFYGPTYKYSLTPLTCFPH